jgi:hypothetical protein
MTDEPSMSTASLAADPLKTAADAMSQAVQAARDGAADAQTRVAEMMPAVSGFVSRLVYTTSYAVSFGVVFPTLFVVQVIPKDNALVYGLVDGARAARDALNNRDRLIPSESPLPE